MLQRHLSGAVGLVAVVATISVLVLMAWTKPHDADGLIGETSDGLPKQSCATHNDVTVYLSAPPPVTGNAYYVGMDLKVSAVAQVFRGVEIENTSACDVLYMDLPEADWNLVRPQGSQAVVMEIDPLDVKVKLDEEGEYNLSFVACPSQCYIDEMEGIAPFFIDPIEREVAFTATDELAFPPHHDPVIPDLSDRCTPPGSIVDRCTPTFFSDDHLDYVCAGGGGVVDPQWVTVRHWDGPEDYVTIEGEVERSRVSRKDTWLNHHSQDMNIAVTLDEPYFFRLAQRPEWPDQPSRLGVEWEEAYLPERLRPTPGDRISVFGYWIHDCGHPPFYTEVHPPVGLAVHKSRPVEIPSSEGLGGDIYVPGIVTDIWFNEDSGEITDNCSSTGLHQPGAGQDVFIADECIPVADTGGPSPLDGEYEFYIYLPPNPADILKENGHPNPPEVELYLAQENNPAWGGSEGPAPQIEVITTDDGLTYLKVVVDLTGNPGIEAYARRIVAAWKYPSPDNWGLEEYQVRLDKIHVYDDSDKTSSTLGWAGDWRLWLQMKNVDQEWTELINCNDCVSDDSTHTAGNFFNPQPWTTNGVGDADLGPNLMLFDEQMIWVGMSGFEEDGMETDDDTGTIGQLRPQPDQTFQFVGSSYCTEQPSFSVGGFDFAGSFCGKYTANFTVIPRGEVEPTLSPEGEALYQASIVSASEFLGCLESLFVVCIDENPPILDADWHPNGTHPDLPRPLSDSPMFRPQPHEVLALTEVSPPDLWEIIRSEPPAKVEVLLNEIGEEMSGQPNDHIPWELLILEAVLPANLWEAHFGNLEFDRPVFGDLNCDLEVDSTDALLALQYVAGIVLSAPCYVQGDVDCDGELEAVDALATLLDLAGLAQTKSVAGCPEIGEEIVLDLGLAEPTPTPTPTLTPSPTPSESPTPAGTTTPGTPTFTPTPTPTPTSTPSPTPIPDVDGPAIANLTVSADPVYDIPGCLSYPQTTLISAGVSDPSGIDSVVLWRRYVDGGSIGNWVAETPVFNKFTGKYGKTIDPPQISSNSGRIDYFWEATDDVGNFSRQPEAPEYNSVTVFKCFEVE